MTHFNFNQSLKNLVNNLKGLFILSLTLTTFGVGNVWGAYRTTVNVNSSPATGGYVHIDKSSGCGESSCTKTSHKEVQGKDGFKTSGSFTWYFCHKTNTNYVFKGWTTNQNANSGDGASSNPWVKSLDATISASSITGGNTYDYYAIFARMTADISSKDFGNVNVGQSSSATTITVTHAHASKITAALSGTNASDFSLSKTTIVDNSVSESTSTFTVTFKPTCNGTRQATLTLSSTNGLSDVTISLSGMGVLNAQSLSWNNESAIELNMLNGTTQNISASASSKLAVSYSSNNPDVLSVDDTGKLTAKSVGDATITASQAGDCTYSAATSISKTFQVKTKDTPIFTPNWSSTNLKVGDKVTLGVQYVSDGLNGNFKAAYNSTIFNVTREGNTITIEALNEGNASVAFTQTETSSIFSASKTYSFTVSKIANTLAADATHSMKVDETWSSVINGKNSDGEITMTTTDETVAYYDVTNNKIVAQNTGNQSFINKEVTITISQEATYKYTAAEKTIKVTVNKWDNHISINGNQDSYATSIYMDAQKTINLTASNTDYSVSPITATQTAGEGIVALNAAQTQVSSNSKLGTATWSLSQPENYKYKAANASFTIHVVKEAEATDCYVLNAPAEKSYGKYGDCENKSYQDFNLTGPGKTLSFNMWKYSGANDIGMKVYGYDANGNQVFLQEYSIGSIKTSAYPYSFDIASNVTRIRIQNGGGTYVSASTLNCYASEVRVTRATYLNAANVDITKTASNNDIYPGEVGEGTITINHSLANGGDLKVVWDNPKFTIDSQTASQGINLGDKGCSTGITNLVVNYTSITAGVDVANVTIYNNVYHTTLTITGTTIKRNQEIIWKKDAEIMIIGQTESAAAMTNSIIDNIVTYTSDNTSVIRINNDNSGRPTILEALQPGTAHITVFSAGNEEYNEAYDTKEFTVTDKNIQSIVWNQSLMGLKVGDGYVTLNATATQPDSINCQTGGQRPITYQSANESIVRIVNGNQLEVVGAGVTTITASQAGGEDQDGHNFIAATAEKKVVVRDPNAPCETYIYTQSSEVEFNLGWNAASHQTKTYEIDFNGLEPRTFNFDYKGKVHTVLIDYYAGELIVEQLLNGQWQQVRNFGTPGTSEYTNTGDIELNRHATKMRVKANNGMGYMYFKDCQVTLARYLEGSTLNTFETKVGSPVHQTLTVKYSNISGPLTFTLSENSNFSIDTTSIDGVCGNYGSTTINITYTPTQAAVGEDATLTLADDNNKTYITLTGKATMTPLHINWDISDVNSCFTMDEVTLSAKALTDLNAEIPNFVWFSLAQNSTTGTLNGQSLTFDKAGTVVVAANTTGDPRFTPAVTVLKTWNVALTPTEIVTKPEIDGDIIYGAQWTDLQLKDGIGSARNTVNQQNVEGSFTITNGDLSAAGEQLITVTFTPTNTDMFAPCTTTIPVYVQKAASNAIPSASDIAFGQRVDESVLSNLGTTAGTWTWTDTRSSEVLHAGVYTDLQVHFTPESSNFTEIDATVSLIITAPQENTFTNSKGNNDWNDPDNWTSGVVPDKESEVDVIITGEMIINEPIVVNSLTIESGASVKVVVNGDLTVQGQSQDRAQYGDLFVKNGGEVILPEESTQKLIVHNLVIESTIGTSNGTSTSGQISNLEALAFDNGGDAYIDINLDPSGNADDSQWYAFTVPFPVDIATGIARKELDGSFKVLQDHTNFDILRYNPTLRLNTGKGWEYYHGTLQPGEFYLIAIDGTNNVYSFRKKKDAALISANTVSLAVNGDNTNVNANWNAVGNPTLQKVTASFSNKIVQVYVNGESRYQAVMTEDANFVVGCPFFIQASVAENLTLTADNTKSLFYAPARQDDENNTLFRVRFGQDSHFTDQIFVSASEQALNQYEIGHDVAKIGVGKLSAQLWVNAYSQQLCAHEAVLTNDLADMALTLYAPKAGEYTLSVARDNMPAEQTLYLTQDGQVIWNLSESDYTIETAKGNNTQYGLRLISSHRITTDNEQLESHNRAEKFIMNHQLYILRDGQLYDATGKKIQ